MAFRRVVRVLLTVNAIVLSAAGVALLWAGTWCEEAAESLE